MKIRKFYSGGIQFSPASVDYSAGVLSVLGQSQGTGTSSSTSESQSSIYRSDEKGAIGILNKAMTDALLSDTLPNEAQFIINNSDIFGQNIDPLDPYSSSSSYAEILQSIQMAKYNKELYNNAIASARSREALKGPAINTDGTVWVKTNEGLRKKYAEDITPADVVVSVAELAQLRAYNPQFAFNPEIIATIENSTSVKEIQAFINSVIDKIGSEGTKIGIYGTKSELRGIHQGLASILSGTSAEGIYKGTIEHSSNTKEAQYLLRYVYRLLEPNQRAYLEVMAGKMNVGDIVDEKTGQKVDKVYALLVDFIQGKYEYKENYDVDFQKDQTGIVFGKAAIGEEDNSKKQDGLQDIKSNPALRFYNEYGEKGLFTIQVGNYKLTTVGTIGSLYDSNGNPMDWSSLAQVSRSMFGPSFNMSQAYFGGFKITDRNKVQVDGTQVVMMYLPAVKDGQQVKPDFSKLELATQLQKRTANMTDINQINRLYIQAGLPAIYKRGNNGAKQLLEPYARFAVMHGYADKNAIPKKDIQGNNTLFDRTVQRIEDENEIQTVISRFKEFDKNYTEATTGFIFTDPDIYEGIVFIPMYSHVGNTYQTGLTEHQSNLEERAYQYQNRDVGGQYNGNTIKFNY